MSWLDTPPTVPWMTIQTQPARYITMMDDGKTIISTTPDGRTHIDWPGVKKCADEKPTFENQETGAICRLLLAVKDAN